MVEWISNWAKGITMAVIIATIIEMILPDNNNKKYIKMVIGTYVLFAIITPITSAIKGKDYEFNVSSYEKYFENTYQVSSDGLSKNNDNNIEKIYTENIKTDIKQKMSNKGYEVREISINIETGEENYGNIEKIELKLIKKESNAINEISVNKIEINNTQNTETKDVLQLTNSEIKELKQYLSDTYSVAKDDIEIS